MNPSWVTRFRIFITSALIVILNLFQDLHNFSLYRHPELVSGSTAFINHRPR
jgi:hypothetical protein